MSRILPGDGPQVPLSLRWDTKPFWGPLNDALGLTPTGAALAVAAVLAGDWVSYSRTARHYDQPRRYRSPIYTWRTVVSAVDALDHAGLIDHDRREPGQRGWQSAFCAEPELVALVMGLMPTAGLCPAILPETVWLRDDKHNQIDYGDNRSSIAMRRTLCDLNEAIAATEVTPDVRGPVVRIFNGDWQHGGRFYALGDGVWQSMSGEARKRLQIDGETVGELDYRSLHPSLLYAEAGAPMPADCYDVPPWPRALVKRALLIAINAPTEASARLAVAHEAEMNPIADPGTQAALRSAGRLLSDLRRLHGPIAYAFGTGAGLRLMKWDSDICEKVLKTMLRQGIVCLPIHDSFLVAERHLGALEAAMIEAAERHGASLKVARK